MIKNKEKKIVLSISLIVKNEEENLARCLDSLQTLMRRIPCQLIITDTGSTDNTVEIAKKYTDEVYFFEWCDDFSAARNYGLKKAVGEWFMFMDADEFFEDTEQIEAFFVSGQYKNFKSAIHKIRNYSTKKNRKSYIESTAGRLFKNDKIKFEGRIHESIKMASPVKLLASFSHHFSYAQDNDSEYKEQKGQRNLQLLRKELEDNPENLRTVYHLIKQFQVMGDDDRACELNSQWYEKMKYEYDNPYHPFFFYNYLVSKKEDVDEIIRLLENYTQKLSKRKIWDLELFLVMINAYCEKNDLQNAFRYCCKAESLFEQYMEGSVEYDKSYFYAPPDNANETYLTRLKCKKARILYGMGKVSSAEKEIASINLAELQDVDFIENVYYFIEKSISNENLQLMIKVVKDVCGDGNAERIRLLFSMIEEELSENFVMIQKFTELMVNEPELERVSDSAIIWLYRFRTAMDKGLPEAEECLKAAYKVLERNGHLENEHDELLLYSDFLLGLYWASNTCRNFFDRIDTDEVYRYAFRVNQDCDRVKELVLKAEKNDILGNLNLKEQYFTMCLLEQLLLQGGNDGEPIKTLVDLYMDMGHLYMKQCYNPQLLNDVDIVLLPKEFRFIYCLQKANAFADASDFLRAITYIKEGIKHYPAMHKVVDGMLSELARALEDESQAENARVAEFNQQAQLIKAKIVEIANMGMRDQAIELLNSYKQINPADTEGIKELERVLGIDN